MNSLAQTLNHDLESTVAFRLLSDLGRRMYFPRGIVAQAAEANAKAHRFNATVGMAYENGIPMGIPIVSSLVPALSTAESVAYSPTSGVPALRELWLAQMKEKNPSLKNTLTSLPTVVPGLTAGITVTADLFAEPGDTLLLPDLFWGNYRLIFEERRRTSLAEFPFFDQGGAFNREAFSGALDAGVAHGKVMVILNFPNNPAGYSPTRDDADFIVAALRDAADRAPVLVISDDAYFGLFFDPASSTESLFARLADLHENLLAVKVDGATKEDFVWGFRVGFVTFAWKGMTKSQVTALEQKYMGAIRSSVSSSSTLSQNMLLHMYKDPLYQDQKARAFTVLRNRFDRLQEILREKEASGRAPALEALPCNSGYFMSFRCIGISAEELRTLLLERGVGTISVKDTYLRVAFAGIDVEQLRDLYAEIFSGAEALAERA